MSKNQDHVNYSLRDLWWRHDDVPGVLNSADIAPTQSAEAQLQMREREPGTRPGTQDHLVQVYEDVRVVFSVYQTVTYTHQLYC